MMNNIFRFLVVSQLALVAAGSGGVHASETKPGDTEKADSVAQANAAAAAEHGRRMASLAYLAGEFEIRSERSAAETTPLRWQFRPILGGRYLELEGRYQGTDFRLTLGWDAPHRQYRLTLLDSGSGALDLYSGQFDDEGVLVLTNDHHFRVRLEPRPEGWAWVYQGSRDKGKTWQAGGPVQIARRIGT